MYANPANSYRWHSGKRFHPDGQTKPLPRENFEPFRNANLAREADIKKLVAVETDTEETKSAMESDKTKKEVDTEAAGEVASRSKELSKRKQKAIERAKEYLSSAAKGKELSKRDLHLAMHHVVFDDECEECLGGKQRRAPHSHKGASKLRKRWFCVDTGGPVSLKTFRGERYWAGWHEEESQFEMSDPLVSKHSRNMVKSLQNFSLECGFRPNGVSSDGGKEMQGEFNEEIVRIGAQRFVSEPDRSWEAGAAEVRQGTSHALAVTLMEDSNVPEQFWGLGLKHADLARNLILGRWEHLRGEDSWKKAMSRLIPFGNAVSVVIEEAGDPKSFAAKAVIGWAAYMDKETRQVVVLWDERRWKLKTTSSCKDLKRKYFTKPRPSTLRFKPPQHVAQEATVTKVGGGCWIVVSCCGKARYMADTDYELIKDEEIWDCATMGYECKDAQDPTAFLLPDQAGLKQFHAKVYSKEELQSSAMALMTKAITRKEAMSKEKFPGSSQTWEELTAKAIKKEMSKYERYGVYTEEAREYGDWLKEFPRASRVWLGLVYYVKFWELPWADRVVTARYVTYGNQQLQHEWLVSGVLHDEILWSMPPSLRFMRLWYVAMTLMNYEITFDDLVAAYLHAELRGDPVVCTLPIECQSPEERKMKDHCRRLLKASYGLTRAGHDYSAWAENLFDGMKWTNARSFDVEPSAYVRNLDGSRVLASNPPSKR